MNTDNLLARAHLLYEQKRYDQTLGEVERVLQQDPDSHEGGILLALTLTALDKPKEGLGIARGLVGNYPDSPAVYFTYGHLLFQNSDSKEAEHMAKKALELDPTNASTFELLARIYADRKEWTAALDYANQGLALSPEDVGCLNARSICLTKLERTPEAQATIDELLLQDPENAYSHATVGWNKLEHGDYAAAKLHFAEALRLDPTLNAARVGMIETLKSKNFIYRYFLKYYFWMDKFKSGVQFLFIILIWLSTQVVSYLSESYPVLLPLFYLLIAFAYLSWISGPLFNLLLKLDKHGRYMLSERENQGAGVIGILLGVAALTALAIFFTHSFFLLAATFFLATIIIPIGHFYTLHDVHSTRTKFIAGYTLCMVVVGLLALLFIATRNPGATTFAQVYIFAFITFSWVANGVGAILK